MPYKDFTNRPNAVDIFTGIRVSIVVLAVMFPSNILILLAVCVVIYLVKRNNNRYGNRLIVQTNLTSGMYYAYFAVA